MKDLGVLIMGALFTALALWCLVLLIRQCIRRRQRRTPSRRKFLNRVHTSVVMLLLFLCCGRAIECFLVVFLGENTKQMVMDVSLESFVPSICILALAALLTYLWTVRAIDAAEDEEDDVASRNDIDTVTPESRVARSLSWIGTAFLVVVNLVAFISMLIFTAVSEWNAERVKSFDRQVLGYTGGASHFICGAVFLRAVFRLHQAWEIIEYDAPHGINEVRSCKNESLLSSDSLRPRFNFTSSERFMKYLTSGTGLFFALTTMGLGALRGYVSSPSGYRTLLDHHDLILTVSCGLEIVATFLVVAVVAGNSVHEETFGNFSFVNASLIAADYGGTGTGLGSTRSSRSSATHATLPDGTLWAPYAVDES